MLIVRDAQGLRDEIIIISDTLRDIAIESFQGKVEQKDMSGLLLLAATEINSCIDKFVEVESERSNSNA